MALPYPIDPTTGHFGDPQQSTTDEPVRFRRWCFPCGCLNLSVLSFRKKLSLLPTLGLLINLYLMTELGISNWTLFFVWLLIGLGVYFTYGYKNSKLGRTPARVA